MKNQIDIKVKVDYLAEHSEPTDDRYAFAYTITITNKGDIGAKLIDRHWLISDENGQTEEVIGEGVIGKQPYLRPNESFEYTSGAVIRTATGTMKGSYGMKNDDGEDFRAPIPLFLLSRHRTLH